MLYVWGLAALLDAEVVLRIEDHDRQRCRAEYEAALLEDLEWLGFEWANRPLGERSDYRQSDCEEAYQGALRALASSQRVYRCVCSRKDRLHAPVGPDGESVYSGRCRDAGHPASAPHGLRLAWPSRALPETFTDGLLGPLTQKPEQQCGDLLLRDRLGQWSYQFAVAVDDARHGVDCVVRGADLLPSTGRQIRLARLLGRREAPRFFHHPLALDANGRKLSKKQQAPALRELRRNGVSPGAVLGKAACAVGLLDRETDLLCGDVPALILERHRMPLAAAGLEI